MRFNYTESEDGQYIVTDTENKDFNIMVYNEIHAIVLTEILNKGWKKIEYQNRVIDKCIKNEKKYQAMLEDKNKVIMESDYIISKLNKEKRILKKIIIEDGNS